MAFTQVQQDRKAEILASLAAGSVDATLFDELKKLNTAEAKAKTEREGDVAGVVKSIGELGIKFSELQAAFDIEEVKAALGLSGKSGKGKGKGKAASTSSPADHDIKNPKDATKTFTWIRNIEDKALKATLFADFKAGKAIDEYLVNPSDKVKNARIVARLERESAEVTDGKVTKSFLYSDDNLKTLNITRADLVLAETKYQKAAIASAKQKAKAAA